MARRSRGQVALLMALGLVILLGAPAVAPEPAFEVQPEWQMSYVIDAVGNRIYDVELAGALSMGVADPGFSSMLCFFMNCYSGGMLDDLVMSMAGKGDVALMAATQYHNKAYGMWDSFKPFAETLQDGIDRPVTFFGEALNDQLALTGESAPTASQMLAAATENDLGRRGINWLGVKVIAPQSEQPQGFFLGLGKQVKIGKKADGTNADSVHAILFTSGANKALWNDLDRAYHALLDGHGIQRKDITVLAGYGASTEGPDGTVAPSYVDGRGSRWALFKAIRELKPVMNDGEQLILWIGGHGGWELNTGLTSLLVSLPARLSLLASSIAATQAGPLHDLGPEFLQDVQSPLTTGAFVRLLVKPDVDPELMDHVRLFLNSVELPLGSQREIDSLDSDPDIDALELNFLIEEEDLLGESNRIEVDWADPTLFVPYTILGLGFGIGDSPHELVVPPEPEEASSHLLVLPTLFHPEELYYVSKLFLDGGCEVSVATPNGTDEARSALGELAFDVEFVPLDVAADSYDGVHFLGYGWYVDWYLPVTWGIPVPEFTRGAVALIEHALGGGITLGGIGSGVWALVLSGLMTDIELSIYDCPDLIDACLQYGIIPITTGGASAPGVTPFPISPAHLYWADGTPVVSLPAPTSWYGEEEGDAFVGMWGAYLEEYVHTVCE